MQIEETNRDFEEIMKKFLTYKGTIVNYCKENNMTEGQFYYYKKKYIKKEKIFHAISIKKAEKEQLADAKHENGAKTIDVEIGKLRIHIPSGDTQHMANIIKELMNIC